MKKVLIALLIVFLVLMVSCDPEEVNETKYCRVNFEYDITNLKDANILSYTMQVRAIPMFGGYGTGGRIDNWTTVRDSSGAFTLDGFEEGSWAFYLRVLLVDGSTIETLDEQFTGSLEVTDGKTVVFGETKIYGSWGRLGLYIRADRVSEKQSLTVRCENLATGAKYDLTNAEWAVMEKGTSYIDYSYITEQMPAGNWMVNIAAINDVGIQVMSMEEVAIVNPVQDEVLTARLRNQKFDTGSVEIEEYHNLEGILVGTTKAYCNSAGTWIYEPLNAYTQENAVWYYWYVDDQRRATKEPEFSYTFESPGCYLVSCVPVGINGEVPKDGSSIISVDVAFE